MQRAQTYLQCHVMLLGVVLLTAAEDNNDQPDEDEHLADATSD